MQVRHAVVVVFVSVLWSWNSLWLPAQQPPPGELLSPPSLQFTELETRPQGNRDAQAAPPPEFHKVSEELRSLQQKFPPLTWSPTERKPSLLPNALLEFSPDDDEIERLQKARIKALGLEIRVYRDKVEKNAGELPQLLDSLAKASKQQADCLVELLDKPEHKLAALRMHLAVARELEAIAAARAKAGGPPDPYLSALAQRLDVEITIARLQRSANADGR